MHSCKSSKDLWLRCTAEIARAPRATEIKKRKEEEAGGLPAGRKTPNPCRAVPKREKKEETAGRKGFPKGSFSCFASDLISSSSRNPRPSAVRTGLPTTPSRGCGSPRRISQKDQSTGARTKVLMVPKKSRFTPKKRHIPSSCNRRSGRRMWTA